MRMWQSTSTGFTGCNSKLTDSVLFQVAALEGGEAGPRPTIIINADPACKGPVIIEDGLGGKGNVPRETVLDEQGRPIISIVRGNHGDDRSLAAWPVLEVSGPDVLGPELQVLRQDLELLRAQFGCGAVGMGLMLLLAHLLPAVMRGVMVCATALVLCCAGWLMLLQTGLASTAWEQLRWGVL